MNGRGIHAARHWSAVLIATCLLALTALGGCSSSSNAVTVQGDFPVVFAKRATTVSGNPTDSVRFAPGGDLMMVDLASPSAPMVNLTASYTKGKGDVSDPEVSYDGTRVLFSMKGPDDANWNIFEMDLATRQMHRIAPDPATTPAGDDVDPAYLPDGRIVFASNRQLTSKAQLAASNTEAYTYLDEYDREQTTALHVMNADGTGIHQISMNQSHDRNPTVLMDGRIMFSRWDHLGARNHFPIFTVNPDGTGLFIDYGAFSPGNSFLHPREMPNGHVMSDLMPLNRTHEGGALMGIDVLNFSEDDQPVAAGITGHGQTQLTLDQVNFDMTRGLATTGRYTTPYPLWDGTNRALVSWSPSRPVTVVDPMTGKNMQTEGNPRYGVYMFDLGQKTLRPIAIPPEGWNYVDPIAVAARPVPNVIPDEPVDPDLAAAGYGVVNIKSVYDTDFLDIMGQSMLSPSEKAAGEIPQITPPSGDLRSSVADIARIKDPAQTRAAQRPARFLRVTTAVPTPQGISRETIGETMLEMQRILGYTVIQPDGSARILVPADTPFTLSVVDANGLSFQRHTDWLQVRPGETRTCNGCHSPRRGVALNITPIAGNNPNTLDSMAPQQGESMAETYTRLYPSTVDGKSVPAATLSPDMTFVDVWTDPAKAGHAADPSLSYTYAGLTTPAPVNGVIDYPTHIAPLFTKDRGTNTCTNCHNNTDTNDPMSAGIDLTTTVAGTGRMQSYESLTLGPIQFDPTTGLPQINITDNGDVEIVRAPAQVATGGSGDSSRSSQLFEKLYEMPIHSGIALPVAAVNHAGMLNASEMRLLAEWADLGAQYYNDPFKSDNDRTLSNLRGVSGLSEDVFDSDIEPILMNRCSGCHQPFSGTGSSANDPNSSFHENQFVLTGNPKGDYDVTLTMVSNVCQPAQNALLYRPSNTGGALAPHPLIGTPAASVLPITDADYATIFAWIQSGASACTT
jgi:hypothetical protein